MCDAAVVPKVPLSTPTNLKAPLPLIGPIANVPRPTEVTFSNSVPISKRSPSAIEDIPAILIIESDAEILPPLLTRVVLIGVNAIGDWIKPSILMTAFSNLLDIEIVWTLPAPSEVNVTAVPAFALANDVASLKLSSSTLIANTSVGKSTPAAVSIASAVTPINVLPGVYFNFSPVLKKWSLIENTPVTGFNFVVSVGVNVFANIGTPSCFKSNSVIFALVPLTALYWLTPTVSVTRPYVKSGGVLNKSRSVYNISLYAETSASLTPVSGLNLTLNLLLAKFDMNVPIPDVLPIEMNG